MSLPPPENSELEIDLTRPAKTNLFAFWGKLVFLAIAMSGLAWVGTRLLIESEQAIEVELDLAVLEQVLSDSSKEALRIIVSEIDPVLSDAYRDVYAAIPEYVDFHFSVLGEYSELFALVMKRKVDTQMQERLFDEFHRKLDDHLEFLDTKYIDAYASNLNAGIQAAIAIETPGAVLREATHLVLNNAVASATLAFRVAGTAGALGTDKLKAVTDGIARKIAVKVATKAAIKRVLNGGSVLTGTGAGVALCAWSGPLAPACGAIGGVGAWLLADAAIVNLDELFTREEFEDSLREMVDQHKADLKELVLQSFTLRGQELDEEIAEDFRLKDVYEAGRKN